MDEIIAYPRPTEILLKAMEVAEILNVSRAFAYRLMQNGKIRTVAIEGVRRVRQEDLTMYIESRLSPPIDDMVTER